MSTVQQETTELKKKVFVLPCLAASSNSQRIEKEANTCLVNGKCYLSDSKHTHLSKPK